jgi:hypothetical protein
MAIPITTITNDIARVDDRWICLGSGMPGVA